MNHPTRNVDGVQESFKRGMNDEKYHFKVRYEGETYYVTSFSDSCEEAKEKVQEFVPKHSEIE